MAGGVEIDLHLCEKVKWVIYKLVELWSYSTGFMLYCYFTLNSISSGNCFSRKWDENMLQLASQSFLDMPV